jgi:DNA repair protein RecO (recombination protein O)
MFYAVSRFEIVFCSGCFSGRKSNQNRLFPTLTILEIEAVHKNKGTLEISRNKIASAFHSIHSDIYKSTMVMFIQMLHHSIHEEEENESLLHFLETALHWLNHDEIANFHLILLLETTKLGFFYPDI